MNRFTMSPQSDMFWVGKQFKLQYCGILKFFFFLINRFEIIKIYIDTYEYIVQITTEQPNWDIFMNYISFQSDDMFKRGNIVTQVNNLIQIYTKWYT